MGGTGLFGIADSFGNQVKKLFNPSKVRIDNFIFTLHHQWTFVIVIVGLIFATGNNYLNKDAMICNGGNSYVNAFCFLHGSAHVAKSLQEEITSATACVSEDDDDSGENRTTTYYIWLPFILAIIAIMIKMPWILWKNILERGLMKKLNADMDQDGSKTAERFLKVVLRGRRYSIPALVYNFGFAFCEMLNLAVVLISQSILDSLLNSEFASYGLNVQNYRSFVNDEALRKLPEAVGPRNPMCHLFPTEVSCSVRTGGITGNANRENILCLLPNNIFYQYYFLILWWWWVVLIFITCLGLVYRLVQITVPAFGR